MATVARIYGGARPGAVGADGADGGGGSSCGTLSFDNHSAG